MTYILEFDIVAVILSLIAVYTFVTQKKITSEASVFFSVLLFTGFAGSLFGVISSLMINALPRTPSLAVIGTTLAYYMCNVTLPVSATAYIHVITTDRKSTLFQRILFLVPWSVGIVLIATTPLTKWVFFISSGGSYEHGPGLYMLYGLSALYMPLAILFLRRKKSALTPKKRLFLYIAMFIPVPAILVQRMFPHIPLECFAFSLGVLFTLLTIQNNRELTDPETGVFNRDAAVQFFAQQLRTQKPFRFILVYARELSRLQSFLPPHAYGTLSKSVTTWLENAMGKGIVTCKIDDGFYACITVQDDRDEQLLQAAHTIDERQNIPWEIEQNTVEIPFCIAVIRAPEECADTDAFLNTLDQFMEVPDRPGEGRLFSGSDFTGTLHTRQSDIAYELEKMLKNGQTTLYYQPVYSATEKKCTEVEVLLRVILPDDSPGLQSEVLRIAAKMGIASELFDISLRQAARFYREERLDRHGINRVQIRIPEARCIEIDWPQKIMDATLKEGVPLSAFCFEITETTISRTAETLFMNMKLLSAQGASFALDDFGSGYTDFSRIFTAPFSMVKIDKEIIRGCWDSKIKMKIIAGLVSLFREQDVMLAAEGVEDAKEYHYLKEAGFDMYQGYLFAHPVEGHTLPQVIESCLHP